MLLMLPLSSASAQFQLRSVEAGSPRAWEAGMGVNPFTTLNLYNGNAVTAIHLVTVDPIGPALSFGLFHNSSAAQEGVPGTRAPWGFELGWGWRPSYSANIKRDSGTGDVTLIEDDGNEWYFDLSGGDYLPPAGRFDVVIRNSSPDWFEVTSPNLTVRRFEPHPADATLYRLITITDSASHVLTVHYQDGTVYQRISHISTAAEDLCENENHRLTFTYLNSDPNDANDPSQLTGVTDMIDREWTFAYDDHSTADPNDPNHPTDTFTVDRLITVNFPTTGTDREDVDPSSVDILDPNDDPGYTSADCIRYIRDREGHTWKLQYTSDRLTKAIDPPAVTSGPQFEQVFSYPTMPQNGYWRTDVTDRRGQSWRYEFGGEGELLRMADPLGLAASPKYYKYWDYDADYNVVAFEDEYGEVWEAEYGDVGNLETLTGPELSAHSNAQQVWEIEWEQPDPNFPNYWRATAVTDPAGHWVEYEYDPNHMTRLVTITEMGDGIDGSRSEDPAVTTLAYYDTECHNGLLKSVTDQNSVVHDFEYDEWGYSSRMTEGGPTGAGPSYVKTIVGPSIQDPVGVTIEATGDEGPSAYYVLDSNDNQVLAPERMPVRCKDHELSILPERLGSVPSPHFGLMMQCFAGATYDKMGRMLTRARCDHSSSMIPDAPFSESFRSYNVAYDNLGRPTTSGVTSTIGIDTALVRTSSTGYLKPNTDPEVGPTEVTGPDGAVTKYTYDEVGRVSVVERGTSGTGGLKSIITYDRASRVIQVDQGYTPDGTRTTYDYDEAGRVEQIQHKTLGNTVLYTLTYDWNIDNTVASRTEDDDVASVTAEVAFDYDNRDRLIRELRMVGSDVIYDIAYRYDQLGNRVEMIEAETPDRDAYYTAYHYDTDYSTGSGPPSPHAVTRNNRLLSYDVYQGEDDTGHHLRTVSYVYYKTGDAANIIVKDHYVNSTLTPGGAGIYDKARSLSLHYYSNRSLRLALWETWSPADPNDPNFVLSVDAAREFRYDSPRARYLSQDYDTYGSPLPENWVAPDPPAYTEYMGDTPYLDGTLDGPDGNGDFMVASVMRLFGGAGQQSLDPNNVVTDRKYFHGDLIDSNVMSTDEEGTAIATTAYTAFGEAISWHAGSGSPGLPDDPEALGTRYQYAGQHGYEAPTDIQSSAATAPYGTGPGLTLRGANPNLAPITLSHVGARWYQAAVGRFVQRDPIGLRGGANTYLYCKSSPIVQCDPEGLIHIVRVWGPVIVDDPVVEVIFGEGGAIIGVRITTRTRQSWQDIDDRCGPKWVFRGIAIACGLLGPQLLAIKHPSTILAGAITCAIGGTSAFIGSLLGPVVRDSGTTDCIMISSQIFPSSR